MAHYEIYDLVTSSDFCKEVVIEGWDIVILGYNEK